MEEPRRLLPEDAFHGRKLKDKLDCQLDVATFFARRQHCRVQLRIHTAHGPDEAERADIVLVNRSEEVGVVEKIKELSPQLQPVFLRDLEGLVETGIKVPKAWTTKSIACRRIGWKGPHL